MNKEEMVHCPYNFAHIILKPRMAAHLIKCRLQHPSDKFSICPFNSTHDVYTPELEYHIENCSDRNKLDSFVYVTSEPQPKDDSAFNIELPTPSENWDEETTVGSYLDVKHKVVSDQPVFRIPVGMSKSERKAFFNREVERFENIISGVPSGSQNLSAGPSKVGPGRSQNNKRESEDFAIYLEPRPIVKSESDDGFQIMGSRKAAGRGYKMN